MSLATQDVGGLPNLAVVVIEGVLYAIALSDLGFATRTAIDMQRDA